MSFKRNSSSLSNIEAHETSQTIVQTHSASLKLNQTHATLVKQLIHMHALNVVSIQYNSFKHVTLNMQKTLHILTLY